MRKYQHCWTFGMVTLLAATCLLPRTAWAQPACAASSPVQVQINVHYVTTSYANYFHLSNFIAPGIGHDALLLAALLKGGAQDTQSPQVTTTDGILSSISLTTNLPAPLSPLTNSIQMTPHLNKNGSITLEMTNHLETLSPVLAPGALTPSRETTELTQTNTFTNGQTLMVNSISRGSGQGADSPPLLLIFASVKSLAQPSRVHASP